MEEIIASRKTVDSIAKKVCELIASKQHEHKRCARCARPCAPAARFCVSM